METENYIFYMQKGCADIDILYFHNVLTVGQFKKIIREKCHKNEECLINIAFIQDHRKNFLTFYENFGIPNGSKVHYYAVNLEVKNPGNEKILIL